MRPRGEIVFLHTEIDEDKQEKGVGSQLVRGALDDVLANSTARVLASPRFHVPFPRRPRPTGSRHAVEPLVGAELVGDELLGPCVLVCGDLAIDKSMLRTECIDHPVNDLLARKAGLAA